MCALVTGVQTCALPIYRHGFLAFSEIHPDYYQIPKEDREALLAEEAEHAAEEAALRAEAEDAEAEGDVEELAAPASLDDEDSGESRDDHEGEEEAKPRGKSRNGDAAADDLGRKRMALRRRDRTRVGEGMRG